jgi:hypothetical protein
LWWRIVIMKTGIVRNHFFPDNAHHLFKQNCEMRPTTPCCSQLLEIMK